MKIFLTKTPVVITFALICCALWGSAFPCIKIGYRMFAIGGNDTASQILFAGIRFLLAGLMVILICSFIYKKPLIPHSGGNDQTYLYPVIVPDYPAICLLLRRSGKYDRKQGSDH